MTPADALREATTMARKRGLAHEKDAGNNSGTEHGIEYRGKADEAYAIADELERMAAEAVRSTP